MSKKYLPPLMMWLFFEAVAVSLALMLDNLFYFFNFTYIGTALAIGLVLYEKKKKYARNAVQLRSACTCSYIWVSFAGKTCR